MSLNKKNRIHVLKFILDKNRLMSESAQKNAEYPKEVKTFHRCNICLEKMRLNGAVRFIPPSFASLINQAYKIFDSFPLTKSFWTRTCPFPPVWAGP